MADNVLTRSRRRFGYGLSTAVMMGAAWWVTPGLPVLRAPHARAEVREAGRVLFEHEWEPHDAVAHGDGLGPVFNARSCVACHFQGGVGGGGGNDHNVTAFEAHPTRDRREVAGGLIHKYAVANHLLENRDSLKRYFPIVPGGLRVIEGCQILTRDFDPVRTESINSTALFGAGWIDRISAKNITHQSLRKSLVWIGKELNADFTGIPPGRYRVLPDGRVGKFGWKGQFATLEDFVAAACANEIGLGNPRMEQAAPRVGFEYPAVEPDLDRSQFRALVAFVETLPQPIRAVPSDAAARREAEQGQEIFGRIGCAHCHSPEIGGVAGLYSDFLLHSLEDRSLGRAGSYGHSEEPVEMPLPIDHPRPDEWKTPPLWGVADSAPYFHDGGSPTLADALQRHAGDAEPARQAYRALPSAERDALIAFLKTLRAPGRQGPPAPGTVTPTSLASAR